VVNADKLKLFLTKNDNNTWLKSSEDDAELFHIFLLTYPSGRSLKTSFTCSSPRTKTIHGSHEANILSCITTFVLDVPIPLLKNGQEWERQEQKM
jgi:hypothetical protein